MGVYPVDRLYEEVAFVAYHFNWGHDAVLSMPHWERQRWCEEISAINEQINEGAGGAGTGPGGDLGPAAGGPGPGSGPGAGADHGLGAGGDASGGPTLEQEIPDEFFEEDDT